MIGLLQYDPISRVPGMSRRLPDPLIKYLPFRLYQYRLPDPSIKYIQFRLYQYRLPDPSIKYIPFRSYTNTGCQTTMNLYDQPLQVARPIAD